MYRYTINGLLTFILKINILILFHIKLQISNQHTTSVKL